MNFYDVRVKNMTKIYKFDTYFRSRDYLNFRQH